MRREEKRREGKGREEEGKGKGRGREGEEKGREGKGREGKGREEYKKYDGHTYVMMVIHMLDKGTNVRQLKGAYGEGRGWGWDRMFSLIMPFSLMLLHHKTSQFRSLESRQWA